MLIQVEFTGSSYVGVFARASESHVIVPPTVPPANVRSLQEALATEPIVTTLGGTTILGSVVCMNRSGILLADIAGTDETERFRRAGIRVGLLAGRLNAAGNNVLANDRGAVVHPGLDAASRRVVAETLDVEPVPGTVAGLSTVGSAAIVTAKGALCHPKASEEEIELLSSVLKVPTDIGTVNHGNPYISAGLVANSRGAAIGRDTTGPELNRIEDALGLI
ncbi:MAG: translation initiation factor IF-6 [Methanobacteriota archaeon]